MLLKVKTQINSSLRFLRRFSARSTLHQQLTGGPDLETRANMESRIIAQRAFQFACRIVKLCEWLRQRGWAGRKIADQLFDSGTSIGANSAESQGGQTKPDFTARLAVARKESWETIFWLKLATATNVATKEQIAWELDEARQLRAMITQAIKTAQSSHNRGAGGDPSV
jgi:four helix bundle protein